MITSEEFPYISSIHVNDCYTYQDFDIELKPHNTHKSFSHLILTGKNGSGKSTILKNLDKHISAARNGQDKSEHLISLKGSVEYAKANNTNLEHIKSWEHQIEDNNRIMPNYRNAILPILLDFKKEYIYSFLSPTRNTKIINEVKTPTKQEEFEKQLDSNGNAADYIIQNFKQFLVNKKVNQAFAQLENNNNEIVSTDNFFSSIEQIFGKILEDSNLKLLFIKDNYEFLIELSDGRKLTFDVLPDGFSAFFSILMDLFVRLDLIRKSVGHNLYTPCGIVLIDEPETHLHLSLQYQVLPILTTLFPNIQFIVATHSPAVISSIKNVTVFDLTSKATLSDEVVGKGFSELMVAHFGLDNEYSGLADEIFDKINDTLKTYRKDITTRNKAIEKLLLENEQFISPSMRFELEAKISEIE